MNAFLTTQATSTDYRTLADTGYACHLMVGPPSRPPGSGVVAVDLGGAPPCGDGRGAEPLSDALLHSARAVAQRPMEARRLAHAATYLLKILGALLCGFQSLLSPALRLCGVHLVAGHCSKYRDRSGRKGHCHARCTLATQRALMEQSK